MGIIEELKKERKPDSRSETKLLASLYESCLKMIRFKNKYGVTSIIYEVPSLVIGFPLYNVGDISYKLNGMLKDEGFKTTFKYPNKIVIKW